MPLPPFPLITSGMILVVMDGAQRDREFVTDLESQASGLCVADVMCMRWGAPTNQTALAPNIAQVILRALAFRFANKQLGLVNFTAWMAVFWLAIWLAVR